MTKLEKAPDSASGVYQLSDLTVIRESGFDLLLEKDGKSVPILTGVPYDEQNDNMGEASAYRFRFKVSDSSFVYIKYGYEWIIECGIYNVETGKTTLFSHPDADMLIPVAAENGRVALIADTMEKHSSFGPFIYDSASGKTENLNWFGAEVNDIAAPIFGLFGDTLAAFSQENTGFTIRLCNLNDKTDLRTFGISDYEAAQPSAAFLTEDAYWLTTEAYSLSDLYVFRIPTEK